MNIFQFVSFTLVPFIFSVVLGLILIKRNLSQSVLLLAGIFSFLAILVTSISQLFITFIFSQFLKQENTITLLFNSFIYSATIEEMTKFFLFYYVLVFFKYKHIEFPSFCINVRDLESQSLILAMFFASCFAGFENISYIVLNIKLLPLRLITASLLHIFIAQYYSKALKGTKKTNFFFLITAIFLHGTYNIFTAMSGIFLPLSLTIIFFLAIRAYQDYLS